MLAAATAAAAAAAVVVSLTRIPRSQTEGGDAGWLAGWLLDADCT
jgi:hypothetical protein